MPSLQSNVFSKIVILPAVLMGMLMLAACGGDSADSDESCGGHGVFHGDHCDCDAGYSPSADGLSCEADEAPVDNNTGVDNQATDASDATNLMFVSESPWERPPRGC